MTQKWNAAAALAAMGLSLTGGVASAQQKLAPKKQLTAQAPAAAEALLRTPEGYKLKETPFPDFGYMVSTQDYLNKYSDQPIFRLKTDFPTVKPKKQPDFVQKIDFRKNPKEYLLAVRDYSFDGNLPDWDPFKNTKRGWYHIPWLHPSTEGPNAYPPNGGTEGFHGLIKEAPLSPLQLGPGQKGKDGGYSVYAITLVNDMAGYTLGRMWADPNNPDPRATDRRYGGGFPPGTVFAKLLFTDAPQGDDQLPFMQNPLQWTAYITENFWKSSKRIVTKVNLLQMDIAVRDTRADGPGGTGWVFGTFAYNGQVNNPNKFLNLVPVGMMWGNDPDNKVNTTNPFPPTETKVNPDLKETVIFPSKELPPQHLGWNGRLNGPADLNTTSCLSCHNAAQYPAVSSLVPDGAVPDGGPKPPPQGGTAEWMKWFQNVPAGTSMDQRVYSTDFSFQVAIALTNFFTVKGKELQGNWASDYQLAPVPITRGFPD
ncbi:hypothetical protein [Archangium lansingense]|uniref:Cytochrome c domain-containing protein n=1 Tax=Archangium lansingense TaxID=2995310 RepID=A0ABT3ZYS0_9BACT|nr:hypothetical protein [Archangium lansinium]MCY1074471.1 hypothetical protein [Archangium lansinium]